MIGGEAASTEATRMVISIIYFCTANYKDLSPQSTQRTPRSEPRSERGPIIQKTKFKKFISFPGI
jgi:hypothetical protein